MQFNIRRAFPFGIFPFLLFSSYFSSLPSPLFLAFLFFTSILPPHFFPFILSFSPLYEEIWVSETKKQVAGRQGSRTQGRSSADTSALDGQESRAWWRGNSVRSSKEMGQWAVGHKDLMVLPGTKWVERRRPRKQASESLGRSLKRVQRPWNQVVDLTGRWVTWNK